ncbi:glycosyltransferase family 4 protein [Parabacteroides sp. OttesenSCG-928-G07]|nr:glycosyltransferase family 4 protein [Parabacteroides sp. OttesenSCG-928-G21]MDL2278072.1 glycosyltransferase family 4 protein [Parabacteroides sp. OttesenSCG-928-G07]
MKLLQINTSLNKGSTGRIAEQIGLQAITTGIDSYIGYGRGCLNSKNKVIKIGGEKDVYRHIMQTRLMDNHGFSSISATKKFIQEIEAIQPDIIHLHNIHGYYLNIDILFKYLNKKKVPVVWTLHDCWPLTGHCAHFDFVNCHKWQTECNYCPNTKAYPKSLFFDRSKQNYYRKKELFTSKKEIVFITPSQWLADIVKQSFLKDYPVQVIPNGIDLSVFSPQQESEIRSKYKINAKNIILGVANVWSQRKGLDDFLKLSNLLSNEQCILLVGLKKEEQKKLPTNIIGIDKTENIKELAAFYSLADVFVNPTWVDNFPTTNIEALACGTPVVTYNTGGSPEAIDTNTGIVVEKGDIKGLYNAIINICKDGKALYSESCRKRAEKEFNMKDKFQKYIDLYHKININE